MEGVAARVEAEYVVLAGPGTGGGSVGPLPSVAGPATVAGAGAWFIVVGVLGGYAVVFVGACTALLRRRVGRTTGPVLQSSRSRGEGGEVVTGTGIGGGVGCYCCCCGGGTFDRGDLVEDLARIEAVLEARWFRDERSNANGTVGLIPSSVNCLVCLILIITAVVIV